MKNPLKSVFSIIYFSLAHPIGVFFIGLYLTLYAIISDKDLNGSWFEIIYNKNIFLINTTTYVFAFGLLWLFLKNNSLKILDYLTIKKPNLKMIFITLITAILYFIFTYIVMYLLRNMAFMIQYETSMKQNFDDFMKNILSGFIMLCIIVPIFEECVYRGFIFKEFSKLFNYKVALISQALIFALIHLEPLQIAYTFIFGLISGFIYYKSKNITYSIVFHFTFNALGFSQLFLNSFRQ